MKDSYTKGELAKEILKGLALGGFIAACFVCPNFAQVATLFDTKDRGDRKRLKRSIRGLERERLVRIRYDEEGNEIIEITKEGKKRVLKYKFHDLEVKSPKKWDGFWRLVTFDIPEKHKRARDDLSSKLKEIGFYPLQKSVFVFPYECWDEIEFIGEFLKIRKYINYFVVKKTEDEEFLKGTFGLK